MSKLGCPCGNVIRDITDYLPYKARFQPDEDWYGEVDFVRVMYECEVCGRLLLKARPDEPYFVTYLPESPRRGILRHEGAAREE